jgi:hypothetical protein
MDLLVAPTVKTTRLIMHIVQKRDMFGNWIDLMVCQSGNEAMLCYDDNKNRGEDVQIIERPKKN